MVGDSVYIRTMTLPISKHTAGLYNRISSQLQFKSRKESFCVLHNYPEKCICIRSNNIHLLVLRTRALFYFFHKFVHKVTIYVRIPRLGFLFFELLILLYIPANPLIISKIICKYMWN